MHSTIVLALDNMEDRASIQQLSAVKERSIVQLKVFRRLKGSAKCDEDLEPRLDGTHTPRLLKGW